MDGTVSEPTPIACMLDAGAFKKRLAWIADLNYGALLGSRRDDLRLELAYASQAFDRVRELVRREQQCCAFLDFDLRVEGDTIRLIVTAPEAAREAAELIFEPLQSQGIVASVASCGCEPGCAP